MHTVPFIKRVPDIQAPDRRSGKRTIDGDPAPVGSAIAKRLNLRRLTYRRPLHDPRRLTRRSISGVHGKTSICIKARRLPVTTETSLPKEGHSQWPPAPAEAILEDEITSVRPTDGTCAAFRNRTTRADTSHAHPWRTKRRITTGGE
ncbi:hypothetical protein C3Y91_15195 [Rhizobium sp. UPM1133]|nr:hypothetical protein [Rhizobium ruizarguesonis]